jgi:hypothetical protein
MSSLTNGFPGFRKLCDDSSAVLLNGIPGRPFKCKRMLDKATPFNPSFLSWLLNYFNQSSTRHALYVSLFISWDLTLEVIIQRSNMQMTLSLLCPQI